MAKRGDGAGKRKTSVHKYFAKDYYIGSNPVLMSRFEGVLARINEGGIVVLLDQGRVTKQTLMNALMLWASDLVERKGVAALEKELLPIMKELGSIVAADMKERGRMVDPEFLPEGFQVKTKPAKRPRRRPGPTGGQSAG